MTNTALPLTLTLACSPKSFADCPPLWSLTIPTAAAGKILRLCADPDTVTLLHLAEYLVELSVKHRFLRHRKFRTADGSTVIRPIRCLDNTDGIVDWVGEDYFAVLLREYLARGRAAVGQVADARSELIEAAELLDHSIRWMHENLASADSCQKT